LGRASSKTRERLVKFKITPCRADPLKIINKICLLLGRTLTFYKIIGGSYFWLELSGTETETNGTFSANFSHSISYHAKNSWVGS
jgi:hypothetical protein